MSEQNGCRGVVTGRWHAVINDIGGWSADPGPYEVGELAICLHCGTGVTVICAVTNDRLIGTQYVAHLAEH